MKRFIAVSFIIYVMVNQSYAQNVGSTHSPEERAQMQTKWMKNYLQPEEQQLKQIDSLNLKYALRMEELKNSNGRWNKLKKARALVEEKDEKLKHILNEEQFNIYLEKRKDLRKKMSDMRKDL